MRNLSSYNQAQQELSESSFFKEVVRLVEIDGVQVAWMKVIMTIDGNEKQTFYDLYTENDLQGQIIEKNGKKFWQSKYQNFQEKQTIHVKLANQLRIYEIRQELKQRFKQENPDKFLSEQTPLWFSLNNEQKKQVVLELFERHKKGEWIGQIQGDESCLWFTPIVGILETDQYNITNLCLEMMKEKLIGLSGVVITDWSSAYEPQEEQLKVENPSLPPQEEAIDGLTFFYSETGSEGGHWAVQNLDAITWEPASHVYKTQKVKNEQGEIGVVIKREQDQITVKYDQEEQTVPINTLKTQKWDYSGLRILKTGDWIEIFSDQEKTQLVWKGYVHLRKFPVFTEDANGMWIHAEQIGEERNLWASYFQTEHYVTFIPKKKS